MKADDVVLSDGQADSSATVSWDERLTPFVEWSSESVSRLGRRGWLVWRGETDWEVTPEMVERAWALYGIGVQIADNGHRPVDLATLRDHLPLMRSLRIAHWGRPRGYGELRRARKLEFLEIETAPTEDANLSRLWHLREYTGPGFGAWASVLALPRLEVLNITDTVRSSIEGPVRTLMLRSGKDAGLPALAQPATLRDLHVARTGVFDLSSLLPAVGLHCLTVSARKFVNVAALADMPTLSQITLEGTAAEDTGILARLRAPMVILDLKPRAGSELIKAAVTRDWLVNANARDIRLAYEAAGRVVPDDREQVHVWSVSAGDLQLAIKGGSSIATLTSEKDDLPHSLTGSEAEILVRERIRRMHGSDAESAIVGASSEERMVIRFKPWALDRDDVASAAAEVFAEHHSR